jgi:hypothetical protein
MATTKATEVRITLAKSKNTKRYTKYDVPEGSPFTGALYVPLDANNPETLNITITLNGK